MHERALDDRPSEPAMEARERLSGRKRCWFALHCRTVGVAEIDQNASRTGAVTVRPYTYINTYNILLPFAIRVDDVESAARYRYTVGALMPPLRRIRIRPSRYTARPFDTLWNIKRCSNRGRTLLFIYYSRLTAAAHCGSWTHADRRGSARTYVSVRVYSSTAGRREAEIERKLGARFFFGFSSSVRSARRPSFRPPPVQLLTWPNHWAL